MLRYPGILPQCPSNGGTGMGAGHACECVGKEGHEPFTADRPHGCSCGALWADA